MDLKNKLNNGPHLKQIQRKKQPLDVLRNIKVGSGIFEF
ncbi:MAG: hypothetical protein RL634_1278 [Bacteroidota bacterium]